MDSEQPLPQHESGAKAFLSDYYASLTDYIVGLNGNLLAFHYGLWGADTTTDQEALLRSTETLVQGCNLGPEQRVLDAGCGVGGTAIMLAEKYGVHVTGLNICEPHIAVATEHAERRGVGHLVEFRYGDFMSLPFPDESFDLVLNHESFCYVPDKLAYFQGIHRVLKPGAKWQALDGYLSGMPMSEDQEAIHACLQHGWHMPPLDSWRDVLSILEKAGFEQVKSQDLTSEAMPSAESLRKKWQLFTFLVPPSSLPNQASRECMDAAISYGQGLQEGIFTYHFVSAMRPT